MNRKSLKALSFLAIPAFILLSAQASFADPAFKPSEISGLLISQAQKSGGNRMGMHQERHDRMIQELGLNEEQARKMKTIQEAGKSQSKSLDEQLQAKRRELMQYMQS